MTDLNTVGLTADIVASYVSNNTVAAADLPALIQTVHAAFSALDGSQPAAEAAAPPTPAVPIKSSVKPDYLVCLENGAKLKMLKRYLRSHFDMTPEEYRAKWNLPRDYPMVAPNYAATRRELAVKIGLGRKPAAQPAAPAAKRGRPRKAAAA